MPSSYVRSASILLALTAFAIGCGGGSSAPVDPGGDPPIPSGIGAAGGTVTSSDGRAVLVVPPNALTTATNVEIVAASAVIDPAALQGSFYEVRPASVQFAIPAELSVQVNASTRPIGTGVNEIALGAVSGEIVSPIATSSFQEGTSTARVSIPGGGTFAAVWRGFPATCTSASAREFDYWIGSWNWSAPNAFPGTEDVTRDPSGCVLRELFVDASGARGRSISYFSPTSAKWHQVYVDNRGGKLVFTGSLVGSTMTLLSSPTERTRWVPIDANTIRVEFQGSTDGGATWQTASSGTFARR